MAKIGDASFLIF